MKINVGPVEAEIVLKNIKNVHLTVYPPRGRVRIAAPLGTSDEVLRLFIVSRLAWIKRQQLQLASQTREIRKEYTYRESHYFQGRRYLLNIIEQDSPPQVIIRNKTYLDLYVRPGATRDKKMEVMNEWYREALKSVIPQLLAKWESTLRVKAGSVRIKQMKTKWGSYASKSGSIWLNLELAKKPIPCVEYILVHELIHLLRPDHSEKFFSYLDRFLPGWRALQNELNRYPTTHHDWEY